MWIFPSMRQVQILIAGGGPVGMTLACDLARRGITCMLVERNLTTTRHPKMDITSLSGHELHRFHYPSVMEWRRIIHDVNDGSMPAEPPMRVSQVEIEPVLQTEYPGRGQYRGALGRRTRKSHVRRSRADRLRPRQTRVLRRWPAPAFPI